MAALKDDNTDAIYYRDGASTKTAMNLLLKGRLAMFNLFMTQLNPSETTTIIDIGISDDENDAANFLEKRYPWPHNITCAGIGKGEIVKALYPACTFRQIQPGAPLPFADNEFDIACSNAVLEHVGGPENRAALLKEHLRVAKTVFVTVPHRWFPVEHHTGLPLIHYTPTIFRKLLAGTRYDHWAKAENLNFLDRDLLAREWPGPTKPQIVLTGLALGLFSSNIAIIWRP